MNETGPGNLSLSERLKARSAEDLREVETAIRTEHAKLAENLRQSSNDALDKIRQSISAPITEIEREIATSRNRMMSALTEIEVRPLLAMRRTAIQSAVIGALIASLPWAAMSYFGVGLMSETWALQEQRRALMVEIEKLEARAEVLSKVWVEATPEGRLLVVPVAQEKIVLCGNLELPCMKLME